MSALRQLQSWYVQQCDGNWEHDHGVQLFTLANPGWSLTINFADTELEDRVFVRIEREVSENEWIHCWVENHKFEGRCGSGQLEAIIEEFVNWAGVDRM